MSGSKPPGWEPDEPDPADPTSHDPDVGSGPAADLEPGREHDPEGELEPLDDSAELAAANQTDETDAYSQAYSAPEAEHFSTGPYVPADLRLYEYDDFDESSEPDGE